MQEQPDERKWHLAAKLLTDQLTTAELAEWETLLADEQFRYEFELLQKHWHTLGALPYDRIRTAQDWKMVMEKIQQQSSNTRLTATHGWRYAAALALLVVSSVVIWKFAAPLRGKIATTVEAPPGARTAITLPDSSHVWLNAGSKISFNQDFGTDNRDVTLEGEAFFDVEKSDVLFQVHTSAYDIAVLGTAFNVRAYNDEAVTTTLIRGSLKVRIADAAGKVEEYLLTPNDRLTLRSHMPAGEKTAVVFEKNIDAVAETEWKDGWLTVRGESLDALSKKIERLYNVKIHFEDEALKNYRYTGRIQQFSLEQVLKALSLTSPIEFVIHEKSVTLRENKTAKSKYEIQAP